MRGRWWNRLQCCSKKLSRSRQKTGEQHAVPVLVGKFLGELIDLLAVVGVAPITGLFPLASKPLAELARLARRFPWRILLLHEITREKAERSKPVDER